MKKQATIALSKKCEDVAATLKALAHPQRLTLLCHLSSGERTVSELEKVCTVSQSAVSQFLKRMKLEGLVRSEKRGLRVYYSISDPKVKLMITSLHNIFCK